VECTSVGNLPREAQNLKSRGVRDRSKSDAIFNAMESDTRKGGENGAWIMSVGTSPAHIMIPADARRLAAGDRGHQEHVTSAAALLHLRIDRAPVGSGRRAMMLSTGHQGRARLITHLWRMCLAMFIATGSFFLGQAKVFPKPLRIFPLLAIPALLPLALLLFWLVRVWFTHRRARVSRAIALNTIPAV
jgi:hypothetical protein